MDKNLERLTTQVREEARLHWQSCWGEPMPQFDTAEEWTEWVIRERRAAEEAEVPDPYAADELLDHAQVAFEEPRPVQQAASAVAAPASAPQPAIAQDAAEPPPPPPPPPSASPPPSLPLPEGATGGGEPVARSRAVAAVPPSSEHERNASRFAACGWTSRRGL